jgi:hypothetical protein
VNLQVALPTPPNVIHSGATQVYHTYHGAADVPPRYLLGQFPAVQMRLGAASEAASSIATGIVCLMWSAPSSDPTPMILFSIVAIANI